MKGFNFTRAGKAIFRTLSRNKSTLFTIGALLGLGGVVYAVNKAAPKAAKDLEEAKRKKFEERVRKEGIRVVTDEEMSEMSNEEYNEVSEEFEKGTAVKEDDAAKEKLTFIEKVKYTGKRWIVTGILVLATAGCIIAAHYIDAKTIAGLSVLYATQKDNCEKWMEEAKNRLEPEQYKEAKDEIAVEEAKKQNIADDMLKDGESWFYDVRTKRYFPNTMEKVTTVFADAYASVTYNNGQYDWWTLCDKLGEDEIMDELENYLYTSDTRDELKPTIEPVLGCDNRYTIEYGAPKHYRELGRNNPYC